MLSLSWIAWIPPRLPGFRAGRPSNFGGRLFVGGSRRNAATVFSVGNLFVFRCDYMAVLLNCGDKLENQQFSKSSVLLFSKRNAYR